MIKIYHNPRCTKSREGICELDDINQPYEIIKYLETPLNKEELVDILKKLNYKPMELVRTKEAIWVEKYKGKKLSDNDIIMAMVENPKLIERPIIVNGNKAVVARPKEKIKEIL
ncbi:arsenate reductase (glutaredoxin) [uncultured Flavobacterium sp.]|uniref:arsenate reductase (glutaredoxin) n=1 Tax=uncultured Flavobacterium sp. TaxID=165435 RepID=UPI0030EE5E50|tara:strand:- start:23646 stop:23987 length:342 start_codon:yes stop_codon:yes gene_type:complete